VHSVDKEFAPAKVNLTLRVLGRRADGYHDIESLAVFAAFGDEVSLALGRELGLTLRGPTAPDLGDAGDNLVLKATAELAARVNNLVVGRFTLVKQLPVAAGLGGGSTDAAAALRLLAKANNLALTDPRVMAAAKATSADVPVCLDPRARVMRGIGDKLSAPVEGPRWPALLVNPGVPLATKDVFAAYDRAKPKRSKGYVNDLEPIAVSLVPVIGDVLKALGAIPGCRLARLSGSGASCFALFDTSLEAMSAASRIRDKNPRWWLRPTVLNG
jgi:4-diphosphocytidyl-2-C-methyl-D-erythritol kinase